MCQVSNAASVRYPNASYCIVSYPTASATHTPHAPHRAAPTHDYRGVEIASGSPHSRRSDVPRYPESTKVGGSSRLGLLAQTGGPAGSVTGHSRRGMHRAAPTGRGEQYAMPYAGPHAEPHGSRGKTGLSAPELEHVPLPPHADSIKLSPPIIKPSLMDKLDATLIQTFARGAAWLGLGGHPRAQATTVAHTSVMAGNFAREVERLEAAKIRK